MEKEIICPNCNQLIPNVGRGALQFYVCNYCSYTLVNDIEKAVERQTCPKCGDNTLRVEIKETGDVEAECYDCAYTEKKKVRKKTARTWLDALRRKSLDKFADEF